ncbi:amidase signature domain-containing protein [Suillus bovinus]|uniref:amidase signature domain-containing protein n=1 Tax=Suillus bovinus TaxID=48563 RepID=UPI001B884E44|nr:amidase signature domain-containing protein [Suillus bovinus]KAG2136071.1 amidase signature domain-containing protein [Suillus bovinus]
MFATKLSFVLSTLLSVGSGVAYVTYGTSPRNGQPLPDLLYATIDDLQSGLAAGTFTSVDLVNAYVARIDEVNPVLHAVIETNPDALSIAASLDAERAAGSSRGVLHGIPICIKDNIATLDKMNNTAGSFALLGAIPPSDSTVAAKLKAAGAIIIGKCNLSQWANYRSSNSTNGWTSRGGQTMGAYYPMQDPSGSSSGPGVVSSIGLAAAAVGTETSGSIISPSSRNSLTGIKPSVGLTSRYLVVPISQTQDTIGPLTRTMMDAAYILSVIAGQDSHDNYTSAIPFETIPDYAAGCNSEGLQGAKIGIPRNAITVSPTNGPEITAFNASISVFKELGATIVDNADFPDLAGYLNFTGAGYTTDPVVGADFVADVANYFNEMTTNPNRITNLQELMNFTETYPPEDYPDRNIATWVGAASLNITMGDADYYTALLKQYYYGSNATILGALEAYDLDALIIPSSMSPGYAAIAGYPIVTVPLGYYPATTNVTYNSRGTLVSLGPNFPFGLSFFGRRFSEATLVKYACAFEAATNNPYIIPNIQLVDVM